MDNLFADFLQQTTFYHAFCNYLYLKKNPDASQSQEKMKNLYNIYIQNCTKIVSEINK